MDSLFRVEMLGRFGVRQGDRETTRFRTQKTGSLLAFLALHRSRSYPREVLLAQFWPDSEQKAARTNLSVALNALRHLLEPPGVAAGTVLIADNVQVQLNPAAFTTDVEEFENALRTAEAETDAAKRITAWVTAAELYPGELLPGYYEDWVFAERDRLKDDYRRVLENMVKACLDLRQPERGIEYARRLVQVDPLDEEAHCTLMRLFVAVGRLQDALHQFQELERLLQTDLQITPSAATMEWVSSLHITPVASSETRQASPPDKPRPEPIMDARPRTADARPLQLRVPIQLTRFFGREQEIARIAELLTPRASSPGRLVTLTGPGGTGKTRLSIEVAGRVREVFPGGIWFVPLAELDDPQRLGEALRDALELPRQNSPVLDQVVAFLNGLGEPHLLVLDNFEQIAAGGAPVVWTVLSRVPQVRCLVTSRRPLLLLGEQEVPIQPLPTPEDAQAITPDTLVTYPSVALFVDRAQVVRPEFQVTPRNAEVVAAICEKLEGIPLAIELAAARARALTPAQMLERLTERFELLASRRTDKGERHRSLWAAIDWSYHLLSPELQRLFAQLSVFHGGCTLEAVTAVVRGPGSGVRGPRESKEGGSAITASPQHPTPNTQHRLPDPGHPTPDPDSYNMLDSLTLLRGHSLIQAKEGAEGLRFVMLESLREFAQEQLTVEQRLEMEEQHATYFQQWVYQAPMSGPERAVWHAKFDEELDNLRAVLAWSLREGNEIEVGLRTASGMGLFWWLRGHITEGRRWYKYLLERAGDTPTLELSRALQYAGSLVYMQGEFAEARMLLERSIEISRLSGNETISGVAYEALGNVAYREGDYAQAQRLYEKALALLRVHGIRRNIGSVLGNLANVAQSLGDFAKSRDLNLESIEIWRESGDRNGEARTLHNLANLSQSQGWFEEARTFYLQSLTIHRELSDRMGTSNSLRGLAEIALGHKDYAASFAYAREGIALIRDMDARTNLVELLRVLTDLAWETGQWEAAARAQSTADRVRQELNYPVPPVDREEYERGRTTVREALGTTAYEAEKAEGRKLSLEQALTFLEEILESSLQPS